MKSSKKANIINILIEIILFIIGGYIELLFGIVLLVSIVSDTKEGAGLVIVCIIFLLIGAALIVAGSRRIKARKMLKKYAAYMSGDPTGSIANLASAVGASQDSVMKNLQFMMHKKYLTNVYINEERNCIVIENSMTRNNVNLTNTNQTMTKVESVTVTCKNCGGINNIEKGKFSECDFCGSPMQ